MKIWKKCRVPVGRSGADPTGVGLMNLLYTGRSNRNVTVKVLMNDTHCDKVTMLFYIVLCYNKEILSYNYDISFGVFFHQLLIQNNVW